MHPFMKTKVAISLFLAILIIAGGSVWAQASEGLEVEPCEGTDVQGIVVAVDEETREVTLNTDSGLCTVKLSDDAHQHPIVNLLGKFFTGNSIKSLLASLESADTKGCSTLDETTGVWSWVDCGDESPNSTVIGVNEDGTFQALTAHPETGEPIVISVVVDDADTALKLLEDLDDLSVSVVIKEDGTVVDAGDLIEAYHDEGMGFGVLVKLFAMAEEQQALCESGEDPGACDVTVDSLVEEFNSGTGMGELFKKYGKPELLGVGHVRQEDKADDGEPKPAGYMKDKKDRGRPDHAGPKDKDDPDDEPDVDDEDQVTSESSEDAGPENNGNPPDHAGPKEDNGGGKPDNAGPKNQDKDKNKETGNSSSNKGGNGKNKNK